MRFIVALMSSGLLFGAGACATQRSVTHMSTWSGPGGDYFYIAYAENALTSRIKLCRVNDDNTIACKDEPELDALLNPQ